MYLGLKPLLEYGLLLIRLELSPQWQLGPKGFPLLESVLVLVRLRYTPPVAGGEQGHRREGLGELQHVPAEQGDNLSPLHRHSYLCYQRDVSERSMAVR